MVTTAHEPVHGEFGASVLVILYLDSLAPIVLSFMSVNTPPISIAPMKKKERQRRIVLRLCPDIVEMSGSKVEADLQYVLSVKCTFKYMGEKWHARVGKSHFVFSEEPTREYLKRVMEEPKDLTRHIAKVNELRENILDVSCNCNPFRQVAVPRPDPICRNKRCKATEWIETAVEFVCAKCGTVRTKYEQGLDFRNLKQRSQEQGDANSSNHHTIDPLFSDAVNRQTVVRVAAGVAAGAKPGDKPISVRNMQAVNKRMHHEEIGEIENQITRAKLTIEGVCDYLTLHPSTEKKAFFLFCAFIRANGSLPRENEVIAACLFDALPDDPKIYPKRKRRYLTPYNDTKKKRLKFMDYSKERAKRANSF